MKWIDINSEPAPGSIVLDVVNKKIWCRCFDIDNLFPWSSYALSEKTGGYLWSSIFTTWDHRQLTDRVLLLLDGSIPTVDINVESVGEVTNWFTDEGLERYRQKYIQVGESQMFNKIASAMDSIK